MYIIQFGKSSNRYACYTRARIRWLETAVRKGRQLRLLLFINNNGSRSIGVIPKYRLNNFTHIFIYSILLKIITRRCNYDYITYN